MLVATASIAQVICVSSSGGVSAATAVTPSTAAKTPVAIHRHRIVA
ncbi:MAG: hypothetical protein ACRDL0_08610 [Thermoleophilaceae bacterium]